jgi:hypothetical protein
MPAWGLTNEQRTLEDGMGPWGLHPLLFLPAKVTTDPVHGDIYTTWLEQTIIDSPPNHPACVSGRNAHALRT